MRYRVFHLAREGALLDAILKVERVRFCGSSRKLLRAAWASPCRHYDRCARCSRVGAFDGVGNAASSVRMKPRGRGVSVGI